MALFSLYVDEDSCSERLLVALRALGFDVLTADEAETRGWSDERQLHFAAELGRVILTANVGDFAGLQHSWGRAGLHHHGIIVWKRSRWSPESFADRLLRLSDELTAGELGNAIIYF